jgi:hypothetical protein
MFTASVDLSGFRQQVARTVEGLETGVRDAVRNAAQEGAHEAITASRFKNQTGNLRSNIVADFVRSNGRSAQWEILSRMPYSKFVEEGTRPHEIWPKAGYGLKGPLRNGQTRRATGKGPHEHIVGRGQALRWVSGGQVFFARMVHHPGTAAYPFMGLAYIKAEAVLYREIYVGIDKVARYWV